MVEPDLPDAVRLQPDDEAERLWKGALTARERAAKSLLSLCECLDLGLRTAEILIVQALQPVTGKFPGTIGLQLETPVEEVDPFRDAVTIPKALQFTEILDLLSEESLECVAPKLHRGWEDRRFSCRRSRKTAQEAVGVTLDTEARDRLLLLSAYRNRIFRYPPPILIRPQRILDAYPALVELVQTVATK